jgi:hypothetical protein
LIKRLSSYLLLLFYAFTACDESLDPEGDFFQQYALNCVVRGDSAYQIATVYSSYTDDLSYQSGIGSTFVEGVRIRLWYDVEFEDRVFLFRDSSIVLQDGSIAKFYYTNDLVIKPGKLLEVEAILPFGKRLIGKTKVPEKIIVEQEYFIPPDLAARDYVGFTWEYTEGERIVQPEMKIRYNYLDGEEQKYKEFFVPSELTSENNQIIPFYPQPSYNPFVNFKMDAVRWAFDKISEDDPDKSNYSIIDVIVTLHIYDKNLSSYYSATNQFLDDFSVRIDEIDVTNIEGGLGIFGTFIEQRFPIQVSTDFINEYGYRIAK